MDITDKIEKYLNEKVTSKDLRIVNMRGSEGTEPDTFQVFMEKNNKLIGWVGWQGDGWGYRPREKTDKFQKDSGTWSDESFSTKLKAAKKLI